MVPTLNGLEAYVYSHSDNAEQISTFSVLPQSNIFTTPCDLRLNGETIFHQRLAHFEAHK